MPTRLFQEAKKVFPAFTDAELNRVYDQIRSPNIRNVVAQALVDGLNSIRTDVDSDPMIGYANPMDIWGIVLQGKLPSNILDLAETWKPALAEIRIYSLILDKRPIPTTTQISFISG